MAYMEFLIQQLIGINWDYAYIRVGIHINFERVD